MVEIWLNKRESHTVYEMLKLSQYYRLSTLFIKILNVKNETFFVLSSLYATWCDANANPWQILKLTLETEHRIVDEMWAFARNAMHSTTNILLYQTIRYNAMRVFRLCAVPFVCEFERKWRASCMKQALIAEKKTFTKRKSWNSASMLTAKF